MLNQFGSRNWLNALAGPAIVASTTGSIIAANERFLKLIGKRSIDGQSLQDYVDGSDEEVAAQLRRWGGSVSSLPGAMQLRTTMGLQAFSVEGSRVSDLGQREGPVAVLAQFRLRAQAVERFRLLGEKIDGLSREVVARRKAEEAVSYERERLHITLQSIGDAVIATDAAGCVTFMNAVAEALTGWTLTDAARVDCRKIFNIVNEDTRLPVESPVTRVIREGVIVGLANHTILIARDGAERPIDDSGAPIRDSSGELVGTVLVFRDISGDKAVQNALRESEQRFRVMADAAPVLIWVWDCDGRLEYVNRQWLLFTGRSHQEELSSNLMAHVHPDDQARCLAHFQEAFTQRQPFECEFRLKRHDDEYRWLMNRGQPRHTPDGKFAGYVGSCVDITERRDAERQLLSMNEVLEERVQQRTAQLRELTQQLTRAEQQERRRLAQLLHDHLQQLLAAARMRIEVLARQVAGTEGEPMVRKVQKLLRQSLDASRSLTVELSPPVLYDGGLCAALPWLARHMQEQHEVCIEVEVDAQAEPYDEQTRVAMFTAARELLFNAVKHAEADQINMTLSNPDAGTVRLVVADKGVGFDPEADRAQDHGNGGFGLFSLRERIEFLGGAVAVVSAPGAGTRVIVDLPQGETEPPTAPIKPTQPKLTSGGPPGAKSRRREIRILLADDHQMLREGIMALLLEHADINVVAEAVDGQAALELAREHRPDVVIMDVTMPRLNGIEATRLIVAEMPEIKVLGLSMHDSEDMARAMIEAGALQMLVKDGPSDGLIEAVRSAAGYADA